MSGFPDIDTLATYGGALVDYGVGVVDPTTDRDAGAANLAYMSVAGMSACAPRLWVNFTTATSTGGLVLNAWNSGWGNAPGYNPTLARSTTGVYTITLPSTVSDAIFASHAVNLRAAWGSIRITGSTLYVPTVIATSPNVLTVTTWSGTSVAETANLSVDIFAI